MDIKTLIEQLKELATNPDFDPEEDHIKADDLLLEFIDNADVTENFKAIEKWYA